MRKCINCAETNVKSYYKMDVCENCVTSTRFLNTRMSIKIIVDTMRKAIDEIDIISVKDNWTDNDPILYHYFRLCRSFVISLQKLINKTIEVK